MSHFDHYEANYGEGYHYLLGDPHQDAYQSDNASLKRTGKNEQPVDQDGRSVWDWYAENGDIAVDAANDILCLIDPSARRCRPPQEGGYYGGYQRPDHTVTYILVGLVVILLLAFIFKK